MQHPSPAKHAKRTHTYTPSCQSYSRVSDEVKLDCSVCLPRFSMNQRETTPPALHTQIVPVTTERREMLFLVCHQTKQTGWEESSQRILICVWLTECMSEWVYVLYVCVCKCCTSVFIDVCAHVFSKTGCCVAKCYDSAVFPQEILIHINILKCF